MSLPNDMPKSEMIRRSMRCHTLGWCSLIPIAGVIPAMLAFVDFRAVVVRKGRNWNAARTRLLLGAWLAGLGLAFSTGILTLIGIAIVMN
jgi:hypothetical protein